MGVSPTRLTGWEPAEVTTFEWDGAGRLVRAVTIREPEFSDVDVAMLLADYEREHEPRGRHGRPMVEAMDTSNQFGYEVPPPSTDWAQKALNEAEEAYKKRYPQADMGSLLFRVKLRGTEAS